MFKERIAQSIREISPRVFNVALGVNSGKLKDVYSSGGGLDLPVNVLTKPRKSWAKAVDAIETPFVEEYDQAEYAGNAALNLMGLYEMKTMLSAFGLPSLQQTDYEGKPLYGGNYMVAGTGTGREVINLAALGGSVVGLDATRGYVELTARKLQDVSPALGPDPDIKLYQCPAEDYPYRSQSFDGITSLFGVINHIQNWKRQIGKYSEAIKTGGKLVIEKYGSNNALVFRLKKDGVLGYPPSILQSRDPKGKGILLGPNEPVLPASFPNDRQFSNQLEDKGFRIQRKVGLLRIAALFPKQPTPENIEKFMQLVSGIDDEAYQFLSQFASPEELLLGSFMYDIKSQTRKNNPVNIEDFAYVLYVGERQPDKIIIPYGGRFG